jgi:hypothetical protein
MNPLMMQNGSIPYPNMIAYTMNMQSRPIETSNLMQYTFQQAQAQRMYPYLLNNNIAKSQPQIQNICNPNTVNQINANISNNIIIQSNTIPDNSSTKKDSDNVPNNPSTLKLLTKYKDIYVPSIYLLDYNDTSKSPFNIILANSNQNQTQTYNQLTGQIINNNQNNNIINKYLNYGYNFEQWKAYVNDIRNKFDELNDLVKNGIIRLPDPDNELEYLMAFPSDYGGLGKVQNDQFYENIKFYDPKDTTKNNGNKNFMSFIKFEHDQIWFPLEPNPLNKKINDINKIINSSVNPYLKYYFPQNNFFIRNPNNTIVSNSEIKNNGNNSNKKSDEDQIKER